MSEIWIQCFTCCVSEQATAKRRRRIDRTMIGEPTNFRHTGHIGSGDMNSGGGGGGGGNVNLMAIQNQMQSKGGYEYAIPVSVPVVVGSLRSTVLTSNVQKFSIQEPIHAKYYLQDTLV